MQGILRYVAEPDCAPVYGNEHAAGCDIRIRDAVTLHRGVSVAAKTGLQVEIPRGHVGLIRGRSGLAFKRGIWAFEGTIDEDYRGEIGLLLVYLGTEIDAFVIAGTRVAQLVVVPCADLRLYPAATLGDVEGGRGTAGFGSTGER